jgi:hypothetical protein
MIPFFSGRLPTFVKQGVGAKNGKMWVGQYFLAESLSSWT